MIPKYFYVLLAFGLVLTGCKNETPTKSSFNQSSGEVSANGSTNIQTYSVRGIIRELKPDGKTVVIKHEEVVGYMPAMIMPFSVKDTNQLLGLKSGDQVTFRMLVTSDDGWIDSIQVIGAGSTNEVEAPPRANRVVRHVEPLSVGDLIPPYPFTNQFGAAFNLSQFRGKALALTFIFTRCPFPTFCPKMSSAFADAQSALKSKLDVKNWHLLSLSFDTEVDTPKTLTEYAKRYNADHEVWSFATGALIEIDAITEQFGLVFPRDGVNFAHNLRTVVIDAQGRVHKVFAGNEWKSEELIDEMIKAASADPNNAAK